MAEIDSVRYRAAVAAADAKVAAQAQVLARMLSGSRPEEIAGAKARVTAARANVEDARRNYERAKQLAETQFVSQQKVDNADAVLKTAAANLDAVQQELELAVKGPRQEDIDAAPLHPERIQGGAGTRASATQGHPTDCSGRRG